ncbi:hypothetical protein [Legionella bononiensis]|uniref:AAA domain (Dynein-related subfamily) n=1 Tax=Legionella bononiensis TaxID=2793102 RepID=A0ABS1W9P2_9GAMM|nr:hypothetical protein [Legionella bononiensis]MBL7480725.1 hypothetical protein [Legionella bononiensis]MBL7526076.1 hypothetical protein [Legionella bononiensis]MBL7563429.1 hypothetical protein [Legionella bononiensis]
MSIPGEFYCLLSQTKPAYTYAPTENLDINKLIQSKAPWILPASLAQKPKKLILSDWTAKNWSYSKMNVVQDALIDLVNQGFSLYIQQNGQINPLLIDGISNLIRPDIRAAIRPVSSGALITKATTQYRMSKDETFILDDYWIDRLIGSKEHNAPRTMNQSDYMGLNREEIIGLEKSLDQLNPPLQLLIQDELSDESIRGFERFKKSFPTISHLQRIRKMSEPSAQSSKEQWLELLSNGSFLQELVLPATQDTIKLDESGLMNLIYLDFDNYWIENLADLLASVPNLQELSIRRLDESSKLNTQELQLKFLKLNFSKLHFSQLYQLLSEQAQSIQFLSLANSRVIADDMIEESILLEAPQCLHLIEINLTESFLTIESLNLLLSRAPNLKRLTLGGGIFEEMESFIDFNEMNTDVLNRLESLCLLSLTWDDGTFNLLSNKLTHLKCLHLRNFKFNALPEQNECRMEHVEELIISGSEFEDDEDLKRLLQCFPNIKRLQFINNSYHGSNDLKFDVAACKKVKVVDLSDHFAFVGKQAVMDVVNTAPNLETLNLINCNNISVREWNKLSDKLPHLNVCWHWDDCDGDQDDEDYLLCSDDTPHQEHNLADYRDFEPTPEDFKFQFKGNSSSIDQNMIIEKLSQYFNLNQINTQYIPKIQDGICNALTHLFKKSSIDEWNDFIHRMKAWDGQLTTLNDELKNDFKMLWTAIKQYQFSQKRSAQYIGDNLAHFLSINSIHNSTYAAQLQIHDDDVDDWIASILTSDLMDESIQTSTESTMILNPRKIKLQDGCIVSNFWHAICIRLIAEDQWQVYNPNCKDGAKTVTTTELIHLIHTELGTLVSIEMEEESIVPEIHNPDQFIQGGGLFHLIHDMNSKAVADLIPVNYQFSAQALQGVLLNDLKGVPAWFSGLNSAHTLQFTYNLLEQLYRLFPADCSSMLQKSIQFLAPEQKQKCIVELTKSGPKTSTAIFDIMSCPAPSLPTELNKALIDILRNSSDIKYFEQVLKTWNKSSNPFDTLAEYCQHVLNPEAYQKHLVELDSTTSVQALRLALQRQCHFTNRPIYYIHSPDDLICSASFIQRDPNNYGILRKGPGGPLHDFLTADHGDQPPVLIINYEQFSAEDIVRFNALLDKKGFADGTPVPENVQIIGLNNTNKPDCYQGDDFYSRFNTKEQCPISAKKLIKSVPPLPTESEEEAAEGVVINLFNASDWKERLLGRWELDGTELKFQEGALSNLQDTRITIQNGPWDDEEFNLFWTEACYPGTRFFPGSTIPVPSTIQLNKKTGYALNDLKEWLQVQYLSDDCLNLGDLPHVLNPHRIADYFHNYRYEEGDHSLRKEMGLIEKAQNSTLDVTLTRSISLDDWARILTECQNYQVTLRVNPAPGSSFPDQFGFDFITSQLEQRNWHLADISRTEVIKTTDIDVTISMLTASQPDWHVIDVSELDVSDLLRRVDGQLNEELLQFEFHQRSSWLLAALAAGKNIILKGHCSKELEDHLASLLLQRMDHGVESGTLLLITEDSDSFHYVSKKVHEVSEQDKRTCLGEFPHELEPFIASESLSKLKAKTTYLQAFPECSKHDAPWSGMSCHTAEIKPLAALNPLTAKQEADEFTSARLSLVRRMLNAAPYVFLSGLSGVGKTKLVTKELVQEGEQLHQSIDAIKAWALDTSPGRKYLFLDEATLSCGNWSLFEGLFNNPPSIFYDGQYYPLSAEHKVIFAGNPVSYGDERRLATLFERHGNAVEFEPLPTAVLYEKILKPAFEQQYLNDNVVPQLSSVFLDVYRFMVNCSTTDVLITPRELEMMALLTNSYCQKNPSVDRLDVAAHYAFKIAINLVPKSKKELFIKEFNPKNPLPITVGDEPPEFLITQSRLVSQQLLEDVLDLREWRQTFAVNDVQRYGGLGGLTFEGEPGIGKSEQIKQTLLARGFKLMSINSVPAPGDKPMYLIPVSMSYTDKEALLLKAFHEGAVVVIDEINSSPMMEKLLNSLLMGKTPQGNNPDTPGFLIIGTQNPVTLSGRRAPSNALSRRIITEQLPLYSKDEMLDILMKEGVQETIARDMIEAFMKNRQRAEKEQLSPGPTFRDLLHLGQGSGYQHVKKRERGNNCIEQVVTDMKHARTFLGRKQASSVNSNGVSSSSSSFFNSSKRSDRGYERNEHLIKRLRGF